MTTLLSPALRAACAITGLTALAASSAVAAPPHAVSKATHASSKRTVGGPDLVVRSLTAEVTSDGLDVSVKIANLGSRRSRRSDVVYAISTDATLDDTDDFLDETPLGRLLPTRSREADDTLEIPDDLPSGQLYLVVCADGNNTVRERREDNNCQAEAIAEDDATSSDDPADQDDPGVISDDGDGSADDTSADPTGAPVLSQ